MALALIKLTKKRGNRTFDIFDYISADVAQIEGIEINGTEHSPLEYSEVKVLRIYGEN